MGFSIDGRRLLSGISLSVESGRTYAVLGVNGSGKSLLAEILEGTIEPTDGSRMLHRGADGRIARIGSVSFELQKTVMAEERRNDDSAFLHGKLDPGRTVERFIRDEGPKDDPGADAFLAGLLVSFGLGPASSRGLRFLSSGEFRKALIVRALFARPSVLILDDPFDGLDAESRSGLQAALGRERGSTAVVLFTGRAADVPDRTDEALVLSSGRVVFSGDAERALELYRETRSGPTEGPAAAEGGSVSRGDGAHPSDRGSPVPRTLVSMRSVSVRYLDVPILTDVTWRVDEGGHWRIRGPNGSGKSTLLDLVYGANPKAYGQDITLFGRRKGSGESIWDIRKRIGYVSGSFHFGYPVEQRVLGTVLSGFYDTAGLYEEPSSGLRETAETWCGLFGLSPYLDVPFGDLSFGLQRIALIARAMVKKPELLILDEPCQGVDDAHARLILRTISLISRENHTTLLYVTHDPSQAVPGISLTLSLVPHPDGGYSAVET